ncbi:MAG: flagellar protein FlbB [Spirochaetes bacterium GWD1_61_31]|nr:MAG: flagellar protein FlbB [Spirochaetes bacterium GWB1_60_80]OHD42178.1 MAG: flagellar protein FlbB [Spirochaetes bacterium GWD1_61_31]OHD44508.1 MAG: flagellar protein FlbB [Spirochaetes bacterium GWE1_60_18]OHD59340.1 MAG: flagellar protein FlbB [Spirochaetes bacterium GWF1_60_12]HAP43163.1 flagellar protein FlbB [Spirochaetaceae bacterium]
MASFGKQRVLGRIILMLIVIIALVLGGLFWFDFLGLIDAKALFAPAVRLAGRVVRTRTQVDIDSPTLLDDERFAKQFEAIDVLRQELTERERLALEQEAVLLAQAREIEDRQKNIEEQQNSFNSLREQYENRRANIEQNARYLSGMPPADAVDILAALDDQTAIETLRAVEELAKLQGEASVVSYWLSLLPAERSATLQRKMAQMPDSLD